MHTNHLDEDTDGGLVAADEAPEVLTPEAIASTVDGELDNLLADYKEERVAADQADTDETEDQIDSLDALLSESITSVREEREAREARKRLKDRYRSGVSAAQIAEDAQRVAEWEARHEWRDVFNVALFERHRCACGRQQTIFRQLMREQEHRHVKETRRWVVAEASLANLPNRVLVQKWDTPMCTNCAEPAGFPFTNVKEWEA